MNGYTVAIGAQSFGHQSYSVALGQQTGYECVAIGNKRNEINKDVSVGGINISEIQTKVKSLETIIEELQEIVKKQNEMLISLWYYPGMPGANEAKEQFDKDSKSL